MPQPQLPTELLNKIFAIVAASRDSNPSLLALSLTSRTFRTLAQPLLYDAIEIIYLSDSPDEVPNYLLRSSCARLRETLYTTPPLARACRCLKLVFRLRADGERISLGTTPTSLGFKDLFRRLSRTEVFEVNDIGIVRAPPALDEALAHTTSWRTTLKILWLHSLNTETLPFLLSKPHLQSLYVTVVESDCAPAVPFQLSFLGSARISAEDFRALTSSSHATLTELDAPSSLPFEHILFPFTSLAILKTDAACCHACKLNLWFMPTHVALEVLAQVRQGHEDEWRWPRTLRTVTWKRGPVDGPSLSEEECDAIQAACAAIGVFDCSFED
ncbi:hypothetical protein JCM10450v2_007279 [Rhodotorula kratochvilovae]